MRPPRAALALGMLGRPVGQSADEVGGAGNALAVVLLCPESGAVKSFDCTLAWRKDSVYRWIETRRLPAHKIGRLWKFKLSEVDGWVRKRGADTEGRDASKGAVE